MSTRYIIKVRRSKRLIPRTCSAGEDAWESDIRYRGERTRTQMPRALDSDGLSMNRYKSISPLNYEETASGRER